MEVFPGFWLSDGRVSVVGFLVWSEVVLDGVGIEAVYPGFCMCIIWNRIDYLLSYIYNIYILREMSDPPEGGEHSCKFYFIIAKEAANRPCRWPTARTRIEKRKKKEKQTQQNDYD